ncbi:hypothetical protein AAG906_020689 [Vitis piasezkii]
MARTPLESMDVVSSHSWSHSNQKRRKSTSLSYKEPKQIRVGENVKKLKGKNPAKLALAKPFCNLKEADAESKCLCEAPSFAKSFRNSIDSSAKIFAAAKPILAHECHFTRQSPYFAKRCKLQSMKIPNFAVKAPFRRVFRSCETNFGTRVPLDSDPISQMAIKWRKRHSTICSFPFPSPTTREPPIISSGHHFRPNFVSPIWREPEEPNHPLLLAANESRERRLFKAPPLNLRGQKLLHLRRSPHHRILREASEPIDLTERSRFPLRLHLDRHEPQELHRHFEPQIPSGIAPKVLIGIRC